MKIVISSGHGKYVRGAEGILDEVNEARKVTDRVAELLRAGGTPAIAFHDNTSQSQSENLDTIVRFHNSQARDLDVSVHFNAYQATDGPMGCEVLHVSQPELAGKVATAICNASGLKNRGAKKRTDLAFLNKTDEPAVLLEICFVDSEADAGIYAVKFGDICQAICRSLTGQTVAPPTPPTGGAEPGKPEPPLFTAKGKASSFGGPDDEGVSAHEGLAFITDVEQAPHLFLPNHPPGTTGLARRLNPYVHYVACRWDYAKTPKPSLLKKVALVKATKTGIALSAFPADFGPHESTGRVADLSPCLLADLGIETDDEVEVTLA